jgi:hypothetical protein
MNLFDAKPGDTVLVGQEETRIVNGVLVVRCVEIRQVAYSREYIANMRTMLDEAEQKLDKAEPKGLLGKLRDKVYGWTK